MWMILAVGSAVFAGITAILAKIGIENTDSNVATALRTIVILFFSWLMVGITGSYRQIPGISGHTLLFLVLSGMCTGASWLCYFRALQLGDVNKVVPIDKTSTILTMLLAFLLLGEPISGFMLLGMLEIGLGPWLMIAKKETPSANPAVSQTEGTSGRERAALLYAAGSALFASLTAILGKIGIQGVESNLGTAIRTIVVLVMAWLLVGIQHKFGEIRRISGKSWLFIGLSGISTGLSWMCYYRALQEGPASVIVPIDKLSIVVSVVFSAFVLKEHVSKKAWAGLALIVAGTLALLV